MSCPKIALPEAHPTITGLYLYMYDNFMIKYIFSTFDMNNQLNAKDPIPEHVILEVTPGGDIIRQWGASM